MDMGRGWRAVVRAGAGLIGLGLVVVAVWQIESGRAGIDRIPVEIGETPATLYRATGAAPAPLVVIAHGFAGSRQLMEPFAITLARAGYVALSYDLLGHGRNPAPLTGDITDEKGATEALLREMQRVVAWGVARPETRGGTALLGHSMASDIVARYAVRHPDIAATVAVSMFSAAPTADLPRNLLIVVGAWEGFLAEEALRTLRLSAGPGAVAGQGYGSVEAGTGRRVEIAPNVEHVSVLYSRSALTTARDWLNAVFERDGSGPADRRGLWAALLFPGLVLLGYGASALLPRVERGRRAPVTGWPRFLAAALGPALLTPLILWPLDTGFLPVLVADYLALHFLLYGALTTAAMLLLGARPQGSPHRGRLALATLLATGFGLLAIGLPIDAYYAAFLPIPERAGLLFALLIGTASYLMADERLIRGVGAPPFAAAITKLAFLASLALAVALNLEKLFFLLIILPVVVLFFLLYGALSGWIWRATGHPGPAGIAHAIAFAWALGVTFPLIGG